MYDPAALTITGKHYWAENRPGQRGIAYQPLRFGLVLLIAIPERARKVTRERGADMIDRATGIQGKL
jgi:hypothetical protein